MKVILLVSLLVLIGLLLCGGIVLYKLSKNNEIEDHNKNVPFEVATWNIEPEIKHGIGNALEIKNSGTGVTISLTPINESEYRKLNDER